MAVTFTDNGTNTPNGTHKEFGYTFPTIKTDGTDVKVALNVRRKPPLNMQ